MKQNEHLELSELYNDSNMRLINLEAKSSLFEKDMENSDYNWKNQRDNFKEELLVIKSQLEDLKISFKESADSFLSMADTFKRASTKEQIQKVSRKLDEAGFEESITVEEFRRLIINNITQM
ncbi:MAG: hypothetical protein V1859_02125 [archaeon]